MVSVWACLPPSALPLPLLPLLLPGRACRNSPSRWRQSTASNRRRLSAASPPATTIVVSVSRTPQAQQGLGFCGFLRPLPSCCPLPPTIAVAVMPLLFRWPGLGFMVIGFRSGGWRGWSSQEDVKPPLCSFIFIFFFFFLYFATIIIILTQNKLHYLVNKV